MRAPLLRSRFGARYGTARSTFSGLRLHALFLEAPNNVRFAGTPDYISGAILEGSAYPSITFSFLCAPQVSIKPLLFCSQLVG